MYDNKNRHKNLNIITNRNTDEQSVRVAVNSGPDFLGGFSRPDSSETAFDHDSVVFPRRKR